MNVCVFPGDFPIRSETFVMNHVTGLIDSGLDVTVLANNGDFKAWESLEEYQSILKTKVIYYRLYSSKRKTIIEGLRKLLTGLLNGDLKILSTINYTCYGRNALNFKLLYVYCSIKLIPKIDILHCHFGTMGILGAHLKRLGLVEKLVVTFHGYDLSRVLRDRVSNPYSDLFNQADLLLPISDCWRTELVRLGAPTDRMSVHRIGTDISKFKFKARHGYAGTIHLITIARFTEKKGIRYAVEAVAKAKALNPELNIVYDIVGEGELFGDIKTLIISLGLCNCIKLHGAKAHSEVASLLDQADIFILSSVTATNGDQEGIPVVLMEAMSVGMPIISTWHSGIPELVEDGVSGYLSPERDSDDLANSILRFADMPEKWASMGKAGRAKVELEFNNEIQIGKLIELYRKICKSI